MRYFKALLFSAVLAGCTGSSAVRYSASAQVSTPELVEIEPGVMVVADYDEPVFYTEGVYWRYYGGVWYRSPYYNRSWVRVSVPPVAVRRIQRPEVYVHYRANVRDRREARAYPAPRPEVRDQRVTPSPTPLPPPVVRDVREERREDRQERHEERRDERQDAREERREEKQERREEHRDEKADRREERREEKQERREEKRDDKRDDKRDHGKRGHR
jgi:hypothetical protein